MKPNKMKKTMNEAVELSKEDYSVVDVHVANAIRTAEANKEKAEKAMDKKFKMPNEERDAHADIKSDEMKKMYLSESLFTEFVEDEVSEDYHFNSNTGKGFWVRATDAVIEYIESLISSKGGTHSEAKEIADAMAESYYYYGNGKSYPLYACKKDLKDEDDFLLNVDHYLKKYPDALLLFHKYFDKPQEIEDDNQMLQEGRPSKAFLSKIETNVKNANNLLTQIVSQLKDFEGVKADTVTSSSVKSALTDNRPIWGVITTSVSDSRLEGDWKVAVENAVQHLEGVTLDGAQLYYHTYKRGPFDRPVLTAYFYFDVIEADSEDKKVVSELWKDSQYDDEEDKAFAEEQIKEYFKDVEMGYGWVTIDKAVEDLNNQGILVTEENIVEYVNDNSLNIMNFEDIAVVLTPSAPSREEIAKDLGVEYDHIDEQLTEDFSSSLPQWLRKPYIAKELYERRGVDLANVEFVADVLPASARDSRLQDSSKISCFLLRPRFGGQFVWVKGLNDDDYIDLGDGYRAVKYYSMKKILDNAIEYGYIDKTNSQNTIRGVQQMRKGRKAGVVNRQKTAQYPRLTRKFDETGEELPAEIQWITRSGYDKSGYPLNPMKYKNKLEEVGYDNYQERIEKYHNRIEKVREDIIELLTNYNIKTGLRTKSSWSDDLDDIIRTFTRVTDEYRQILNEIDRVLTRDWKDESDRDYYFKSIFNGNGYSGNIRQLRKYLEEVEKLIKETKANIEAQAAKAAEETTEPVEEAVKPLTEATGDEVSNKLLELVDEGVLNARNVLLACLKYMSTDDVAMMAKLNGFLDDYDDEEAELDALYHDASEDELRKMGAFDNLNEDWEDECPNGAKLLSYVDDRLITARSLAEDIIHYLGTNEKIGEFCEQSEYFDSVLVEGVEADKDAIMHYEVDIMDTLHFLADAYLEGRVAAGPYARGLKKAYNALEEVGVESKENSEEVTEACEDKTLNEYKRPEGAVLKYKKKREPLADIIQQELTDGEWGYVESPDGRITPTNMPSANYLPDHVGIAWDKEDRCAICVWGASEAELQAAVDIAKKYGKEYKLGFDKYVAGDKKHYIYIYVDEDKDFDEPYFNPNDPVVDTSKKSKKVDDDDDIDDDMDESFNGDVKDVILEEVDDVTEITLIPEEQEDAITEGVSKPVNEDVVEGKQPLEEIMISTEGLRNFKPWDGAKATYNTVLEHNKLDTLEFMLEDMYPNGIGASELNDLLWFQKDWVLEMLGIGVEKEDFSQVEVTGEVPEEPEQE